MPTLKVTPISDTDYVGIATLADIRGNCPDPKRVDLSTEAERKKDPDLARAHVQRGDNQRQFNKTRINRAIAYARYIDEIEQGIRRGGYPPITLWTKDKVVFDPMSCSIAISGSTIMTANDGETQLAARYMLASKDGTWLDVPFAFTLASESDKETAMQTLHDMNHYATPVKEKDTAALNVEGPLTKAINIGIEMSERDRRISIKPRGDKPTGTFLTTDTILLHGAIGALYGKDCFRRSPTSLIKEANDQFYELSASESKKVSGFINAVLQLDNETLPRVDNSLMLALGAKYNRTMTLPTVLSKERVEAIETVLKSERGGKRATVHHRAAAFFDSLKD